MAHRALRRRRRSDLPGRTALVTGGSAGLGLALARRFLDAGCRVAICGRDEQALEGAAGELRARGGEAAGFACDVRDRGAVEALVRDVAARFGGPDLLVNNAGVIDLGEVTTDEHATFAEMLDTMFWGVVNPTLAVLPGMRARGEGRIATVTSIGGRLSPPHLVPYACAKHAAYAFSQGLRAEVAGDNILLTTVVPGLMHTGSHRAVQVRGGRFAEYAWFALAGANAVTATDPSHAADRIVRGLQHGDAQVTIGFDAQVVTRLEGLAPATTSRLLALVGRALPDTATAPPQRQPGWALESPLTRSALTRAGREAATDLQAHREGPALDEPDDPRRP